MFKKMIYSIMACIFMAFSAPVMATGLPVPVPSCSQQQSQGVLMYVTGLLQQSGLPPAQAAAMAGQMVEGCNIKPPLVSINASQAFDAYQSQSIDGGQSVLMIDVRTPEELFWVGVPAQVNSITLKNGSTLIPDNYHVVLKVNNENKNTLEYKLNGEKKTTKVSEVASTELKGMVYNIPVQYQDPSVIDPTTGKPQIMLNANFGKQIDALVQAKQQQGKIVDRIIFYCRSGQRSSIGCYYQFCPMALLSPTIINYEVESAKNGRGGFEGTSYNNVFIGYRGFPGRVTKDQDEKSASFKDAGLPILIGKTPKTVKVDQSGNLISLDEPDAIPWANRN